MIRVDPVLCEYKPDLVLVYGDVNSTLAAALVCAKRGIPVGHVEAGLRAFDRSMPEEINRVLTDQVADELFTPSEDGDVNLLREGICPTKIHRIGNVMIDTLVRMLPAARHTLPRDLPEKFVLLTLHRPSNVDHQEWLAEMLSVFADVATDIPVLFPVHPRTRGQLERIGNRIGNAGLRILEPLPYLEVLALEERATAVVTDSGGIQEETTYLGTPCLTVRDSTERPVTVSLGTNVLVGRNLLKLRNELRRILNGEQTRGKVPPLWDGHAALRLGEIICGKASADASESRQNSQGRASNVHVRGTYIPTDRDLHEPRDNSILTYD
jgi:UDP-N-acetylglucosamine 2-epimerase (non-hydrolysing)